MINVIFKKLGIGKEQKSIDGQTENGDNCKVA